MATSKTNKRAAKAPLLGKLTYDERRMDIAREALCQMSYLMDTLGRERKLAEDSTDAAIGLDSALWPLLSARIISLANAALSAVDDDIADLDDYERIVSGAEVSHG